MRAARPDDRLRVLSEVERQALPAQAIDVLVWNIKKTQEPGWSREYSELARGKELVILQEAWDAPSMRSALNLDDRAWVMGVSFVYERRDHTATGVATGSTATPQTARVRHAPTREPLVRTPKAALLTTYALEGQPEPLLVVNLHAINFRTAPHLRQQLQPLERAIETHRGPVLLAGDFNTHHRPRFEVMEAMVDRLGLQTAFPNWTDPDRARRRDLVRDGRLRSGRWPLDHVFVRGLEVVEARVHGDRAGSDHTPLTLRVRVVK